MKSTKETQDAKEELQKKEQIKHAEAKRREKAADVAAKEKIRAKIAADKEERRLKVEADKAARDGTAVPQAAEPVAPVAVAPVQSTSKPASAYTTTRLRLQTKSKGNIMLTLPVDTTLYEVTLQLEGDEHGCPPVVSFMQGFPKKVFERDEERTLKELGLVPSASLIVQ
jgi:UBX domain-containing protein 1/4